MDVHVNHYHYSHPYSWYYSQPTIYVGGGYSSSFWWMMSEWSAERRAMWLYNHQNVIERDAYERGMRDAAVAARVAELRAGNTPVNSDYVDPEFVDDPGMMYTQEHVEAIYNPHVAGLDLWPLFWLAIIILFCLAIYVLVFKVRWGD